MEEKTVTGRNPVLEYLRVLPSASTAELLVQKGAHGKIIDLIIDTARSRGIKTTFCEKGVLGRYESSSHHQGVMLILREPAETLRDDDFIRKVAGKRGVIVVLDQMNDPHNVGSIIRSTEALGGDGVVLSRSHSAPISQTVVKTSAGATAHIKILIVANIARFLDLAREAGFWIIGTDVCGDIEPQMLKELKPMVIVLGSEGSGMRRLTAEKCHHRVCIPLRGNVQSLNASVAAAIVLYEALKP